MRRLLVGATLLILAGLLGSCTRGSVGIFASIEQEVKTQKSNLSENSSITGVAESENHIFASIGNISRRPLNSDDWNGVGNPPGIDSPISVALVQLGPPVTGDRRYFAAFNSQDGSENALFELDIDAGTGSVEYEELSFAGDLDSRQEIAALFAVDTDRDGFGDELYASVRSGDENGEPLFALLRHPGNVGGTEELLRSGSDSVGRIIGAADNIFDGAADGAGNIWFIGSKGGLYRYDGSEVVYLSGTSVTGYPESDGTAGKSFSGVYALDLDRLGGAAGAVALFLSDSDGRVWVTTDSGGTWEFEDLSDNRAFTDLKWLPGAGTGGSGALLIGTRPIIQQGITDQGYYELELTLSEDGTTVGLGEFGAPETSNYSTSDLQDATVSTFYLADSRPWNAENPGKSDSQVFLMTGGIGLWNITYGNDGQPSEVRWE